jgi:predicted transcriptional regulator
MKTITLTNIIKAECKDSEFREHFERELLINEIAQMITVLRKNAKLTQKELAERAGTTQPVVARLESGSDHRMPSLELLAKLARAGKGHLKIMLKIDKRI